jgi:hypothetical protein
MKASWPPEKQPFSADANNKASTMNIQQSTQHKRIQTQSVAFALAACERTTRYAAASHAPRLIYWN